jgi:hypothetical protein
MNTPIDNTKREVIIALHFFEEINGFKEQGETDNTRDEKDQCQHVI